MRHVRGACWMGPICVRWEVDLQQQHARLPIWVDANQKHVLDFSCVGIVDCAQTSLYGRIHSPPSNNRRALQVTATKFLSLPVVLGWERGRVSATMSSTV